MNTSHPMVLAAVNEIIASIGESPVVTLIDSTGTDTANTDAGNALRLLDRHDRTTQARGWTFNTKKDLVFTPDLHTGEIIASADTYLHFLSEDVRIYDGHLQIAGQSKFTAPVTLDVIVREPFEYIPPCFQEYITMRATREFQVAYFGLGELIELTREKEMEAWMLCQEYDIAEAGLNMIDNTYVRINLNRRI